MEKKTVNILGAEYEMSFDLDSKEADGEAKFYGKKIEIKPLEKNVGRGFNRRRKEAPAERSYPSRTVALYFVRGWSGKLRI